MLKNEIKIAVEQWLKMDGVEEVVMISRNMKTQYEMLEAMKEMRIEPQFGGFAPMLVHYLGNPNMCLVITSEKGDPEKFLTWEWTDQVGPIFEKGIMEGSVVVLNW